jgi:Mg2+ and Co2+ transporter CorA
MQVADYSSEKIEFSVLTNKDGPEELEDFLKKGKPEFAKVRFLLSTSSPPYPYPSPPFPPYLPMPLLFSSLPVSTQVRYIQVNGLSWDIIKTLALHYDLHPLSLEDMLHHGSSSSRRSKVDYFRQHLFVSLIVHRTLEQPHHEIEVPEEVMGPATERSTTKVLKGKMPASKAMKKIAGVEGSEAGKWEGFCETSRRGDGQLE